MPITYVDTAVADMLAGTHWKRRKTEWANATTLYMGFNRVVDVADATTTWRVYKVTWSDNDIDDHQGPITGSWTGRALLFP